MENKNTNQTIVALSTPPLNGAISIVRMSGDKAAEIADKLFVNNKGKTPSLFTPRLLELGTLNTGSFTEK